MARKDNFDIRREIIQKPRVNQQIKSPKVRLINQEGKQVGIKTLEEALAEAEKEGLDLVEVGARANPPVCKIMDFGKYLYQKTKQEQKQKKASKVGKLKIIRLSPRIGEHDLEIKLKKAKKFLTKGNKVRFMVLFRGRESTQRGRELLDQITLKLQEISEVEQEPILERRIMIMTLKNKN